MSAGYIWFAGHVRAYSGLKTGVCALRFSNKKPSNSYIRSREARKMVHHDIKIPMTSITSTHDRMSGPGVWDPSASGTGGD